jgi:hypothetical protein
MDDLPPIIPVNAAAFTEDNRALWVREGEDPFLSPQVDILVPSGSSNEQPSAAFYDVRVRIILIAESPLTILQAIICEVQSGTQGSHLVAVVRGKTSPPGVKREPQISVASRPRTSHRTRS